MVAFWIVASRRHAQPFKPFSLTTADFAGYCPVVEGASVSVLPVSTHDPAEPNIIAYGLQWEGVAPARSRFGVRLVHGYNMPMCLKIKGYLVEPVGATLNPGIPLEIWRVTSGAGEVAIWVTTMIRAGDFAATRESVTSMAFPRVDVPDDPNWIPRGFSVGDLRHPVRSFRLWFRARWNASRTDWLTFLRLRQPAWASDELLTYVTLSLPPTVSPQQENEVIRQVVAGHVAMLKKLQEWRKTAETPKPGT